MIVGLLHVIQACMLHVIQGVITTEEPFPNSSTDFWTKDSESVDFAPQAKQETVNKKQNADVNIFNKSSY